MTLEIHPEFRRRYQEILGAEFRDFQNILSHPTRIAIRTNTIKIETEQLRERLIGRNWDLHSIPWSPDGFWVNSNQRQVSQTFEHILGYYYIQEAVSQLPAIILNPKSGERILDLCAAPGSKTTHIAQLMKNQGVIIANDVSYHRIRALVANILRCGVRCVAVSSTDGRRIPKIVQPFDKILVDAPCTGTGTVRMKPHLLTRNPGLIHRMLPLQKGLVTVAYRLLKQGGSLVYSTCSLEPEENEVVINHILKKTDAKLENLTIKNIEHHKGVTSWKDTILDPSLTRCMRIYPHQNDTDGFFVAKVVKP